MEASACIRSSCLGQVLDWCPEAFSPSSVGKTDRFLVEILLKATILQTLFIKASDFMVCHGLPLGANDFSPRIHRKTGAQMKTISYREPYEWEPVVVRVDDADTLDETLEFLREDTGKTENHERRERYHTECSLDALDFEGSIYASDEDVEEDFFRSEQERVIDDWLRSNLTLVQYRRFRYLMEGLSLRDIAELEDADYKSVRESVESARKKLQKIFRDTPSETPF